MNRDSLLGWVDQDIHKQLQRESNKIKDQAILLIYSNAYWSGSISDSSGDGVTISKFDGLLTSFKCTSGGTYGIIFQLTDPPSSRFDTIIEKFDRTINEIRIEKQGGPFLTLAVIQDGKLLDKKTTTAEFGVVRLAGNCNSQSPFSGGGCLIATATYGSELAPQVQQLRELRDNFLLQTASGISFMKSFNQFYYSFSPTIADWERENPIFKETVKLTLTPMISSLSILNHVDMDSEYEVLGYGISLILLNVGMYFVAPAVMINTVRKKQLRR
ncbi:MAG: CFI-box-CTERM domain-containing protein [Nitrosarchaeum sp.]